ncbi:MAG: translation initiation factor IF-3 [Candidatus Deianiraeaceae bacterium]|jgi:translation initiation factor IF-3
MSKIPKKNDEIQAKTVRVVDQSGEMLGIFPVREAIAKARESKLDLLEVSPYVDPPVCKILDFGRYKYDIKKKESDAKQRHHKVEQKEIKMSPNIGQHDYDTKFKKVIKFLEDGHRVLIVSQLRGRERSTPEKAKAFLQRIEDNLHSVASTVVPMAFSGNSGSITFGPKKK